MLYWTPELMKGHAYMGRDCASIWEVVLTVLIIELWVKTRTYTLGMLLLIKVQIKWHQLIVTVMADHVWVCLSNYWIKTSTTLCHCNKADNFDFNVEHLYTVECIYLLSFQGKCNRKQCLLNFVTWLVCKTQQFAGFSIG